MPPRYSEAEARKAVAASRSYAEALRRLGMCSTGGGHLVLKKYVALWGVDTSHFDALAASLEGLARARSKPLPLDEILVEGRRYSTSALKKRLYDSGLKERACELCGQGESWNGHRMSLILDHVNGVRDDNRLENLRIVCPNCNATLDTHCGRNAALDDRTCARCSNAFRAKHRTQQYCSRECGMRWDRSGRALMVTRRVERPPYEQLLAQVAELGWVGVGRKYGVSDNAIRKWVRAYERGLGGEAQAA